MQAIRLAFTLMFALVFATVLSLVAFDITGNEAKEARAESASREYGPFTCQLPANGELEVCAEGIEVPYGSGVSVNLYSAESAGEPQPVQFVAEDKNKNNLFGYHAWDADDARGAYHHLGDHFPRDKSFDAAALRIYAGAQGREDTSVFFFVRITD